MSFTCIYSDFLFFYIQHACVRTIITAYQDDIRSIKNLWMLVFKQRNTFLTITT